MMTTTKITLLAVAAALAGSLCIPRSAFAEETVDNVFFALIGLNTVGYDFDQDFTILSSGAGHLGSGIFSKQPAAEGKYRLTGTGEPHGMILFNGAVSSITWTSLANETWNGFTVDTATPVQVCAA